MIRNIHCLLKYACCILLMNVTSAALPAQEKALERLNTPAAFENMKMQGLWFQSNNAAGALLDSSFRYATADLGYQFYNGDFRRPQQGKTGNNLMFNTEGGGKIGGFYAWGSFSYSRDKVKDANFNSSIIDPYRGMPYYVADTNVSDWNNQHYTLKMRIASPQFWDFLSIGLDGLYQNSVGAKQRDIRTKSVFYTIDLRPGIVLSARKHHFGVAFRYASIREDVGMRTVNSYVDQTYYILSGLGMAVERIGGQRAMTYNANLAGGSFQYSYAGKVPVLLDIDYFKKVEDAITTPTSPQHLGTTREQVWHGKIMADIPDRQGNAHFLKLDYQNRKIEGIEYVQKWEASEAGGDWVVYSKNVRSAYEMQHVKLDYGYVIQRGMEYAWKMGATVGYEKNEERYLIPASARDIRNLRFNVHAKKNFFLSDNNVKRLLIGADLGYNKNQKGDYTYGGYYPDYRIVSEFMRDDTHYLGSDYCSFDVSATYSQWVHERSKANLFAKVDWRYLKTNSYSFDHRMMMCVSVGCNF